MVDRGCGKKRTSNASDDQARPPRRYCDLVTSYMSKLDSPVTGKWWRTLGPQLGANRPLVRKETASNNKHSASPLQAGQCKSENVSDV